MSASGRLVVGIPSECLAVKGRTKAAHGDEPRNRPLNGPETVGAVSGELFFELRVQNRPPPLPHQPGSEGAVDPDPGNGGQSIDATGPGKLCAVMPDRNNLIWSLTCAEPFSRRKAPVIDELQSGLHPEERLEGG